MSPFNMPYCHRVEVVSAKSLHISVSDAHESLPEDKNWSGTQKAREGSAVLYNRNDSPSSEQPFAFTTEKDTFSIDIEIRDIGSDFDGKRVELSMMDEDTYASRCNSAESLPVSSSLVISGSTAVFSITLAGAAPFGFFGKYGFDLRVVDEQQHNSIESVPLEAYYLSAPEFPEFLEEGTPLLLLRMFVLPRQNNTQEWIKNVTNIVFGSNNPFDNRPSNTTNHWLTYETSSGKHSFSGQYGTDGLNLDAWLDAFRNFQQCQVVTRINCYDQAAITEVALCLGLHYEQIHWEYHQPYGFIDASLVGCGPVNSPYFDGTETLSRYTPEDPRRQPFRNHAYLSWSEQRMTEAQYADSKEMVEKYDKHSDYVANARAFEDDNNLKLFMIDACGGPHVGTETREEYEKKIELIPDDRSTSHSEYVREDSKESAWRWKEDHYVGPGITKSCTTLPPSTNPAYKGDVAQFMTLARMENAEAYKVTNPQSVLAHFDRYVQDNMVGHWKNHHACIVRPFTTQDGNTIVYETKIAFSTTADKKMDKAVSMRIAVNPTSEGVLKAAAEHLAFKALGQRDIKRDELSAHGLTIPTVGSYYTRAFVWYNVAIEITIDEDGVEWKSKPPVLMQMILDELSRVTASK
jgi:hypothetical protein